jgi:hypothetical protein
MLQRLKRNWNALKRGRPGSRFEEQYERQQQTGSRGAGRVLRIAAGVVLIPAGLFFLPAPGPGMLIIAVGAALIAREFRFAARGLDRVEVAGRRVAARARRAWSRRRAPRATGRRSRPNPKGR